LITNHEAAKGYGIWQSFVNGIDINVSNDKHYDELHHFVDDEPLDSLDRDKLLSSLFRPVKKRNVLCAGEHVKWNIKSQNV
jgi:hypothetical protein